MSARLVDAELAGLLLERDRILARSDLGIYNRLLWPDEMPAAHHRLILAALTDVAEGRCRRLIVMAPPGSAKSSYGSIRFTSWLRGKRPELDMIAGSFTQELANKFARRVRNTCQLEDWREIWPGVVVSDDSAAVNRWATNAGGEYFAVGVGGSVVGRRAGIAVLDDVSGGQDDALRSKVTRQSVWDWYEGDLLPRLKPDAPVVVIGTHFHADDLIGRLIHQKELGIEDWRLIRLPMVADEADELGREPGDRLWPEYFTEEMVTIARRNNDLWMGAYQQRPIVESGSYFKREWIHEYDARADGWPCGADGERLLLRIYGSSDYAVTLGGGDYTVHIVCGIAEDGKIYLLDFWRGKEAPDTWVAELLRLASRWKPIEWFEEKGQITRAVGPFLERVMRDEKNYVYRSQHAMPRGADGLNSKQVGAQSIRGRFAQHMVWFPKGAWWTGEAVAELMQFPLDRSGVHDDIVDALSLLGRGLDKMVNATPPRAKAKPQFLGVDVPLTIGDFIKHSEAGASTGRRRI